MTRAFDGTVSILQPTVAPLYDGRSAHELLAAFSDQPDTSSHDVVKGYWQSQHNGADFETFWRTSLRDGLVAGTALPAKNVQLRSDWSSNVAPPAAVQGGLELVFRPDAAVYDGQFASNAWLLELPRPFSKISWDNVATRRCEL